jgi:hypothetical protein
MVGAGAGFTTKSTISAQVADSEFAVRVDAVIVKLSAPFTAVICPADNETSRPSKRDGALGSARIGKSFWAI